MDGQLHVRLDLRLCPDVAKLKSKTSSVVELILAHIIRAGATVNDYQFRTFDPEQGYTLTVVLEESICFIQTWPEWGYVNIDVMVCNYTRDNTEVARRVVVHLYEFFEGEVDFKDETPRGPWDDSLPDHKPAQ